MGQSAQKPKFTPFGTLFEPIGYIAGKPVWPVLGGNGEGEGEGTQGGAGESASNAGQSAGEGSGTGDGASGSGQGTGNASGDERPVTREDFERLQRQLSAADKNKSEAQKALEAAQARLKEFEDKDKTDLEKAQRDAEEATKRSTELEEKLRNLAIRDAFRDASEAMDPPLNWHNTKVAMDQLDSSLFEIGDDGSVTGMDKAVKALAKDHAYLLKQQEQAGGGSKTGGSYNNGQGGGTGPQTDREKLARKYRALQGRGGV